MRRADYVAPLSGRLPKERDRLSAFVVPLRTLREKEIFLVIAAPPGA